MYISIDIGKSNTRVSSTLNLIDIKNISKFSTHQNLEEQKKLIADAIYSVKEDKEIKAIALGVTGLVDKENNKFLKSPNYPALNGLSFNILFPQVLQNIPSYVENDASLGALGESFLGAGSNKNTVAYLTLSSGVGGALIIKNSKGFNLISSEIGHHIINMEDSLSDSTGLKGTFESFCSGSMFEERYGVKPERNISKDIWQKYAKNLSFGIINIVSMWKPDIIVLGGGISNHNYDLFYPYLIENLSKQSFYQIPDIKKSKLEDDSGIYGGFVLLASKLSKKDL